MTSPMDDALWRLTHAVERYDVDEELIASAAGSLARMPAELRAQSGRHAMLDAVMLIADEHASSHVSEHDSEHVCGMCAAVRNGLAVAMGVIRAEADLELRRMFEAGE